MAPLSTDIIRCFAYDYVWYDAIFLCIWVYVMSQQGHRFPLMIGLTLASIVWNIDTTWFATPMESDISNNFTYTSGKLTKQCVAARFSNTTLREYEFTLPSGKILRRSDAPNPYSYWDFNNQYVRHKHGADFMMIISYSIIFFSWFFSSVHAWRNKSETKMKDMVRLTILFFFGLMMVPTLSHFLHLSDTMVWTVRHMEPDSNMTNESILWKTLWSYQVLIAFYIRRDPLTIPYVFFLGSFQAFTMEFPLWVYGIRPFSVNTLLYETMFLINQSAPWCYMMYDLVMYVREFHPYPTFANSSHIIILALESLVIMIGAGLCSEIAFLSVWIRILFLSSIIIIDYSVKSRSFRMSNGIFRVRNGRPPIINALNTVLRATKTRARFHAQTLIKRACKEEGLSDFGSIPILPALQSLCSSLQTVRLTPLGSYMARDGLVSELRNRLRMEELFKKNPAILSQSLAPPVVITGFFRTGTTFLHQILAGDERFNTVKYWQIINPAPYLNQKCDGSKTDPRRKLCRMLEKLYYWYIPDFGVVHPIGTNKPEEEVILFNFASWLTGTTGIQWDIPDFVEWQKNQDPQIAYTQLRRILQLLHWNCPGKGKTWALKTPYHLNHLDCLLNTFPGAKVIWTHRDPEAFIPSYCSLVTHIRSFYSDNVDPLEIGPEYCDAAAKTIQHAMKLRDKIGEETFLDIQFSDLINDPFKEACRIYKFIGWTPPENLKSTIDALRHNNNNNKHKYCATDFGLDNFNHKFQSYYDRFLR